MEASSGLGDAVGVDAGAADAGFVAGFARGRAGPAAAGLDAGFAAGFVADAAVEFAALAAAALDGRRAAGRSPGSVTIGD
jgi:hypothetical protein